VQQLYAGLTACLAPWQTPIVGGDICRSKTCTIAITALGDVETERAIRRSAVQVGDVVVVTGVHGAARAGLELLLNPPKGEQLPEGDRRRWILAHQRPQPRLDVSNYIMAQGWSRVAGMDSSDGLADAILQLCRASGVGAHIQARQIPLPQGLVDWVGAAQALDWGLYGGEDFELVLCLPLPQAEALVRHWGQPTRIIGHITPEPTVILEVAPQHNQELKWESGFQHFGAELA
jgi:thiamine-monophosphate kinase